MTKKQKFMAENPTVVRLSNGRFAYKSKCPWEGKNGRELYAYKFCSIADYEHYVESTEEPSAEES